MPFIFKFEELRRYPFRVAVAPGHPFGQLKAVPLEKLAAKPMVSFNRRDYSEHFRILDEIFSPGKLKPRVKVEVDGASSLITEVEACAAVHSVGIAHAVKGNLSPAADKFCESLRKVAGGL